jgi:hypothetical protein
VTLHTAVAVRVMVYRRRAPFEDKFRIFGPTYDYNNISVMQAYKNQLHNGSSFHVQNLVPQQRTHLGGYKIGFNDKPKANTTHTIGELGCDLDSAALLNALTMVSTRRKRSSIVGATVDRYTSTGDAIFAVRPGRH